LPPREWVEQGKHFIQFVSAEDATRIDVARLREMLDQKLLERQARETGICPVREELFGECFDEIIRQVTLNQPERGLLLLRVRDQIKMTNASYQTLYRSAVTFAMRKQLQAEHGKDALAKEIKDLKEEQQRQLNRVMELEKRIDNRKKRAIESRIVDKTRAEEEKKFLLFQETHLKDFYKKIEET
jgi:dynein light intermediate chain, axonemal